MISDVKLLAFPGFANDGILVPVDLRKQIPFKIKRLFYIFGVNSSSIRGQHAHYNTEQILICLKGEVECICKDGLGGEVRHTLNYPTQALYIPRMIWDEQIYHSPDAILLVLTNTIYDKSDYIEDWETFVRECK